MAKLSVLASAEEFDDVRIRSGEKPLLKRVNQAPGIKYPIAVDLASPAQKRSIIMQAELGGVEYPGEDAFKKYKSQFFLDSGLIFANVHRLVRCFVDCQIYLQDGPATRHALELGRSLGARAWENSPFQMKQLPNIGPISVRKLVMAGISSIEALEITEASRINTILSKNPGFGERLESDLKKFPKPRVSVRLTRKVLDNALESSVSSHALGKESCWLSSASIARRAWILK